MTHVLKMYYARIMMMSVTGWKQKYLYGPIAYALYVLAYDGLNFKNLIKAIHANRKIVNILLVISCSMYISYWFGSEKNRSKIEYMQITVRNTLGILDETTKDKHIAELRLKDLFDSRSYKEYLIHKDANIVVPEYVSDEDLNMMFEAADEFNIPHFIFFRMVQKESTFRWIKDGEILTSSAGAMGYTQLMPSTYNTYCKKLNIEEDKMTVKTNLRIGAKLLSDLYTMYNSVDNRNDYDTWKKPLMAYNAGCGNVSSGKADSFVETKNYVASILKY